MQYNITETEALESAILLQSNTEIIKGEKEMKIAIPTLDGKLCGHFGHCETFTFVDIDNETQKIINIVENSPEEGVSCQSAAWVATQGANLVLAGGMGGRPMMIFEQNGVQVVSGCPELPIKELVEQFLSQDLITGENTCGNSDHSHCHGHEHHCGGHHN